MTFSKSNRMEGDVGQTMTSDRTSCKVGYTRDAPPTQREAPFDSGRN